MDLITAIGAAADAAAKAFDLLSKARARKGGATAAELEQVQDLVLSLRQTILALQDKVLKLQEENHRLRSQASSTPAGFERKAVGKGVAVVPIGAERPLYCPNCFDDGKLAPLTETGMGPDMPSHLCSRCQGPLSL